jgi:serine/threonine-protein kinase
MYIRAMDQLEATAIQGSESGGVGSHARMPFFSPSGEWIGFWQEGQLRKVPVGGGAAIPIGNAALPLGATWGEDDVILFGSGFPDPPGIARVSAAGGKPELLLPVDPKNELAHGPQLLPGGRAVLFTLRRLVDDWDDAQIVVQSLSSKERTVLVERGRDARYVESGHVLYARQGSIFALPFDVTSLKAAGTAAPVADGIRRNPGALNSGAVQFSVARDGTLVYVPPRPTSTTLVWVDRQGRESIVPVPPHRYQSPRISPDGKHIAVNDVDQQRDIWIWDLSRENLSRLTSDAVSDSDPVWTQDGRRIIFTSEREGSPKVFWQAADGTDAATRLSDEAGLHPTSISPDGRRLALRAGGIDNNIVTMTIEPLGRVEPLLQTRFTERSGEISPDGRWIAFESDESGQLEVYVRPFPTVNGGRWKISTGGGHEPLWARSGKELFYRSPSGGVMTVAVDARADFAQGSPGEVIKGGTYLSGFTSRMYDISPDGQRFLMVKEDPATSEAASARMIVVQNWFAELNRRAPIRR